MICTIAHTPGFWLSFPDECKNFANNCLYQVSVSRPDYRQRWLHHGKYYCLTRDCKFYLDISFQSSFSDPLPTLATFHHPSLDISNCKALSARTGCLQKYQLEKFSATMVTALMSAATSLLLCFCKVHFRHSENLPVHTSSHVLEVECWVVRVHTGLITTYLLSRIFRYRCLLSVLLK